MPVTQEVYFAHHLAANEKVTRDRALRKLTRWIRAKSADENTEFTEESLMKLWKGLFFCMWMSDKPFIQQELANSIAGLVHCFANRSQSLLYLDACFKTMAREWFAIDRFRIEKFMMLVRRCFRQGVLCARGSAWEDDGIVDFCNMLKITALCPNSQEIPLGLRLHVADVFLQELARMHGAELSPKQALLFLEPFFDILTQSNEHTLVDVVRKNVFFLAIDLDREAAELGVNPSSVKLNGGEEGDEEEEEDMYDQHGRVLEKGEASQDLAAIPFDYSMIADKLFDALKTNTLKPFNRTVITRMVKKYRAILKEGLVRPPVKNVYVGRAITDDDIEAAANKLEEELEEELEEDREEMGKLKKGQRKTKPSFGFDSASGAYEYICNDDSDNQASSGDEADCETMAKQPKKKRRQENWDEEEEDTPSDLSEGELAVPDAKPSTPGRKRKLSVKSKHNTVDTTEEAFEAAGETREVPKKRARRKKRVSGQCKLVDTSQIMRAKNLGNLKKGLNGLDEHVGVAEKVVQQKPCSPVSKALAVEGKSVLKPHSPESKALVVEGKSLLSKKAGPLVLGRAPRKKSLIKKPSGTVQQQVARPSSDQGRPSEGHTPQERREGLLKRREEGKGKNKKRRLSLAASWKVTPVDTEETEPACAVATPFVTGKTSCEDAVRKPQASPSAQPLQNGTPASTPAAKGKSPAAGDATRSSGMSPGCDKVGLGKVGTKAASAKPPSPPVPDAKVAAKSPGIKTPPASSPCTPQLSKPAGTFFRKCLTAAKTCPSKPVMFLTPPAKLSTPSQEEKKVVFALSRNSAQHPREYFETLKNSPQIPFDASKKPAQGVLKARLSLASNTASPARPKKRSRASDFF